MSETDFGDPALAPRSDLGGRRSIILTSRKPAAAPRLPGTPLEPEGELQGAPTKPQGSPGDPSTEELLLDAGFIRVGSVWRR